MQGYVARKGDRYYAVIYEPPPTTTTSNRSTAPSSFRTTQTPRTYTAPLNLTRTILPTPTRYRSNG